MEAKNLGGLVTARLLLSLTSSRKPPLQAEDPQLTRCSFFFFFFFFFFWVFLVFRDRVSLYSPGCPGAHFVDQAGLELRNPPASASRVLGLKACATTPG